MNGSPLSIKRFVSPGWFESHPKPTPPDKTEPCLGWFDDNSGAMSKKARKNLCEVLASSGGRKNGR